MQNIQIKYFPIGLATKKYKLTLRGYTGTAGDSMSYPNEMAFSTKDRDNDEWFFAMHRNIKVVGGTRTVIIPTTIVLKTN